MARFDPRGRGNRALLVGVSEYEFTEPPHGVPGDLPAVKHDVNRLRDALVRGQVFDEHAVTVSRSPSQDEFNRALHTAAGEAEGLLLLYFAGHGAIPSAGDELFLQMHNARVVPGRHAVFPGAEMFTTVLTVLAGSPAERVVVILDCCFAGNAAWLWERFESKRRVLLLMSVQANHRVDAGGPGTPTPFTGELVRLLDEGGELGFRELSDALRARMAAGGYETVRGDPWEPQSRSEPDPRRRAPAVRVRPGPALRCPPVGAPRPAAPPGPPAPLPPRRPPLPARPPRHQAPHANPRAPRRATPPPPAPPPPPPPPHPPT
ncbi:caspase family protein, partial [Streptomyces sp. S3(2020)]|uniref:caspase family protein n=1 Tax=Streptomyces sp. S3(2020) TaxID=2732044 RepID=UPI0014876529